MKTNRTFISATLVVIISLTLLTFVKMNTNSEKPSSDRTYKIIFLHHSTGWTIYQAGKQPNVLYRKLFKNQAFVPQWFRKYNQANNTNYQITEQFFPKKEPYGWSNYPYDYYNIWVKNAGPDYYMDEPTLEILTKQYDMIVFKHCFPVSNIDEDTGQPDINSPEKRLENYKLQYQALKNKLLEFPNTKFLLWTGAVQVEGKITKEQALRTKAFVDWVLNEWDVPGDNIFLWDFYKLETEGDLFLKKENATNSADSHPGKTFAEKAAISFCQRIIDVIKYSK